MAYTKIDNAALRDSRLSYRARGILACALSHDADWSVTVEWLTANGAEGRDAVRSALKELQSLGYRTVARRRDGDGRWVSETEWTDKPTRVGFPGAGNPPNPRNNPRKPITNGGPAAGNPSRGCNPIVYASGDGFAVWCRSCSADGDVAVAETLEAARALKDAHRSPEGESATG